MAAAAAAGGGSGGVPPAAADGDAAAVAMLQAEAFKRLYSSEYYERFLSEDVRPDGRGLSVCRPVSVAPRAVTSADGSAIARVGATAVLAGVRLEVMAPDAAAPREGRLAVAVEVTALATPEYRPGKTPGAAHVVQQRLTDALLAGGVLRPHDLCIAEGRAAWAVYLDVYVLNAAGALADAALLAAVAALRDTRLPVVHVTDAGNVERGTGAAAAGGGGGGGGDGGDGDVQMQQQQQQEGGGAAQQGGAGAGAAAGAWRPLPLHGAPLALTCGLYRGRVVADPDHEEEALMDATVSVALDADGTLLGVHSVGEASAKQVLSCAELARQRHAELLEQLEAAAAQQQQGEAEDGGAQGQGRE